MDLGDLLTLGLRMGDGEWGLGNRLALVALATQFRGGGEPLALQTGRPVALPAVVLVCVSGLDVCVCMCRTRVCTRLL